MDRAILSHVKDLDLEAMKDNYRKVDEIPFDFTRRRMSVVIEDNSGKRQIVTKGAVEEMLEICSHTEVFGAPCPFTPELRKKAAAICERMNHQGLRVLAVAHKSFLGKENNFSVEDENGMVLIGFLAFLDPPKPSAANAIRQLQNYGVSVKILSGDNDAVVRTIARQVGITGKTLSGRELEALEGEALYRAVQETSVFSKVTPLQKTQIITLLQDKQHTVGFLGDGINDAAALRQSDIGISVDSAVDIAKESADIILLEKDLMVLRDGVIEGRRTFGNIVKYIKMTASSNFGNMFSVMVVSAFLPFLPMMPIHLLVQNLLYDISQTTIPFDRMDAEYLRRPRKWDASGLGRFMIWIGPISSIFDITTYLLMWYVFKCRSVEMQALFQSGWFIEGLLSQTLIVHMITHAQGPLFPKPCFMARHGHDLFGHGNRHPHPVHTLRYVHRTGCASMELFPLADSHAAGLLRIDAGCKELVRKTVQHLAVMHEKVDIHDVCGGGARLPPPRGPTPIRNRIHDGAANRFQGDELGKPPENGFFPDFGQGLPDRPRIDQYRQDTPGAADRRPAGIFEYRSGQPAFLALRSRAIVQSGGFVPFCRPPQHE